MQCDPGQLAVARRPTAPHVRRDRRLRRTDGGRTGAWLQHESTDLQRRGGRYGLGRGDDGGLEFLPHGDRAAVDGDDEIADLEIHLGQGIDQSIDYFQAAVSRSTRKTGRDTRCACGDTGFRTR